MSTGVEAEIALDAAVIASLGANRLLGAGAGAAAHGAAMFAALAEKKAGARAEALAELERYERALREAVDRNARVRALRDTVYAAASEHPGQVSLPVPEELDLAGVPHDELVAWCAEVDAALDEAEHALSARLAELVTARLLDAQAAEARAAAPRDRAPELARVLTRLLPDASAADRARVREAAERVAGASSDGEAETLLNEVRLRIQDANRRTREERARLKLWAEEQERLAQAEAERRYILESVTRAFEDLGYQVDTGFETRTAVDGNLVLTRGEWPDQAVRMRIEDGTLRAKMLRTRPLESEDDRRRDAERERQWCAEFERAKQRLASEGMGMAVTWRLEPGAEELPVTEESTQQARRKQHKPKERRLEY
ncbi:response regulator receiver protein [Actinocorallia sp. A-T 12471]|uniref:response regulator receiver protein n=1 Tax=Actinocorallia sp. A-T 12471 TaxID=3089813 RepID=UPI0029CEECEC|nr:response regulator receiver protein [Actinocorallia sp. A-T 12471]MDX6738635.1 response regulator receiver protein [Actinocorallia sp. A-T 12471]